MAGIYIHIPFCRQACNYCDFHFSTSLKNKAAFLEALKKEIFLRRGYIEERVNTIYFGGGTPSLLEYDELQKIFDLLYENFEIAPDAEISLEANPDDLTLKKVAELAHTPINRLSIGIQSFRDEDLKWMHRAHNSEQATAAVRRAQDKGLTNISIDLIYGIPSLSDPEWCNNLSQAFALEVNHISSYCLTVEQNTALAYAVKTGKVPGVDESQGAEQFEIMIEEMKAAGFIQYEISNFCRADFFSRHNSSYWKGEKYVGFGPSAHSFNGVARHKNVSNNARYILALEKGIPDLQEEILTEDQRYNEYILTSLRTMWGTSMLRVQEAGDTYFRHCRKAAERYILSGHLLLRDNTLFLTDHGKLLADRIASDLFI